MTARLPDKTAVAAALRAALEESLRTIAHAAAQAREGATHEENRSEGDKDMRATEQSYIARGQAIRAEELAEQIQRLDAMPVVPLAATDPIGPGALVSLRIAGQPRVFYLMPWGGGTELRVDGARVTVVSPASTVGGALLGRRLGDELELTVRGALEECEIEAIA
jgi:transcription elongation GreA/GreB family factor